MLYGVGRINSSGRIADRAMTSALDCRPGDRLILTAAAGVVTCLARIHARGRDLLFLTTARGGQAVIWYS
jgi:hypothetical protein